MRHFQSHITNIAADAKNVCLSCELFISSGMSQSIDPLHSIFQHSFELLIVTIISLDSYSHDNTNFRFCRSCFHYILRLNIFNFGATNIVNICFCQYYPNILKNLTIVEEVVITCTYPVILILKLRLSGLSLLALYQQIHGHAMVLPQNPGPLLDLLLSSIFQLYEIIRVVWTRKQPHTIANICLFGRVRKIKILNVLLWLKENNILYKDIIINYPELDTWEDEFIFSQMSSKIL